MSAAPSTAPCPSLPFAGDLVLTPISRRPTRLEDSTLRKILHRTVPAFPVACAERPEASVIVVTRDNLAFLRLCLESVLAGTDRPFELIVVDNGSSDGSPAYQVNILSSPSPKRRWRNECCAGSMFPSLPWR